MIVTSTCDYNFNERPLLNIIVEIITFKLKHIFVFCWLFKCLGVLASWELHVSLTGLATGGSTFTFNIFVVYAERLRGESFSQSTARYKQ